MLEASRLARTNLLRLHLNGSDCQPRKNELHIFVYYAFFADAENTCLGK